MLIWVSDAILVLYIDFVLRHKSIWNPNCIGEVMKLHFLKIKVGEELQQQFVNHARETPTASAKEHNRTVKSFALLSYFGLWA